MTKRDYDLIAACFKAQIDLEWDNNSDTGVAVMHEFARRMASELLNTNPRFKMATFFVCCGMLDKAPARK